ncbi:MAG: ester cyclase [Sphingobium sp.]|nr:ester cyclase [Sphingobium sp.]
MDEADRNRAVALRFLKEFHRGEVTLEELYTPDYVHHNEAFYPGLKPGLAAFKEALHARAGGISDFDVEIEQLIAEGDKVVARFVLTGRHSGSFQGIAATGRTVRITATDIYRFEDGRIAEGWAMMDFLGFLQQVGAMPGIGA